MGQYHYLIAGLPDITPDDSKQAYSVLSFREEAYSALTRKDRALLDLFYLKYDNRNLLLRLESPETEADTDTSIDIDARGTLSIEDIEELLSAIKEERKPENTPVYLIDFIKQYLTEIGEDSFDKGIEELTIEEDSDTDNYVIAWEDRLSALYYAYAMKRKNKFISRWFEMNLNIKNLLTAITCRKHGLDKNLYIIGDNPVAENLRSSNAKDFNLGDEIEYLPAILKLAEESDLVVREKRMDLLKWEWLEENTVFKTFGIESVFAYLLKTEMIERWSSLDKVSGEKTFRELIRFMKTESNSALDEFKKNNKR